LHDPWSKRCGDTIYTGQEKTWCENSDAGYQDRLRFILEQDPLAGLVAAYASSPFFEYLTDEISPLYQQKFTFLLDLNLQLTEVTLGILGLNIPVILSKGFTPVLPDGDPRFIIDPKKEEAVADPGFLSMEYRQVFSDRLGFQPNLSILDLIFNEGPRDARSYLQRCLKI